MYYCIEKRKVLFLQTPLLNELNENGPHRQIQFNLCNANPDFICHILSSDQASFQLNVLSVDKIANTGAETILIE